MATFYSIGHSNRSWEEFAELLQENQIQQLVDVRKLTGSTKYPQFNADNLDLALQEIAVNYVHLPELAGRRPASKNVPIERNAWWTNRSFQNYADYALSSEFEHGLGQLIERGEKLTVAVMCSEAVWWRCHRRIITDYLLIRQHSVHHILGPRQVKPAELSAGAIPQNTRQVYYPKGH